MALEMKKVDAGPAMFLLGWAIFAVVWGIQAYLFGIFVTHVFFLLALADAGILSLANKLAPGLLESALTPVAAFIGISTAGTVSFSTDDPLSYAGYVKDLSWVFFVVGTVGQLALPWVRRRPVGQYDELGFVAKMVAAVGIIPVISFAILNFWMGAAMVFVCGYFWLASIIPYALSVFVGSILRPMPKE